MAGVSGEGERKSLDCLGRIRDELRFVKERGSGRGISGWGEVVRGISGRVEAVRPKG